MLLFFLISPPSIGTINFPFFPLLLFVLVQFELLHFVLSTQNPSSSKLICANRCNRLLRRSLDRIDEHLEVGEVLYRIGAFRRTQLLTGQVATSSEELALPAAEFNDICWKFFDFEDCHKQCKKLYRKRRKRSRRVESDHQQQQRRGKKLKRPRQRNDGDNGNAVGGGGLLPEHQVVLQFCRRSDLGIPLEQFACVHKYHTFMEVHCSSYQQRMVELRLIGMQLQEPDGIEPNKFGGTKALAMLRRAVKQELCLRLHQLSSCLINAGQRHCPQPKPILTRSSLREHFLSLLLPYGRVIDQRAAAKIGAAEPMKGEQRRAATEEAEEIIELDQLFSDNLLDHCQLFDFNNNNKWVVDKKGKKKKMGKKSKNSKGKKGEKQQNNAEEKEEEEVEFDLLAMIGGGGDNDGQQQRSTTKRAIFRKGGGEAGNDADVEIMTVAPPSASNSRRVFSSEEDLADIPPNFFYSTARLPKDFYTRYAIWWGGRKMTSGNGRQRNDEDANDDSMEFTSVQLLPTGFPAPAAYTELTSFPGNARNQQSAGTTRQWKEVPLVGETHPDTMPLVTSTTTRSGDNGWTITLPYLVNGRVTVPKEQWPNEGAGNNGTTTAMTVIRLMGREEEMTTTQGNSLVNGNEGVQQDTAFRKEQRRRPVDEEYEEEWAYEDDFASAEFDEEDPPTFDEWDGEGRKSEQKEWTAANAYSTTVPSLLEPVTRTHLLSSSSTTRTSTSAGSVEELIKEIEPDEQAKATTTGTMTTWHRNQPLRTPIDTVEETSTEEEANGKNGGNNANQQPLYTTTAEAEPLFRETNIYFAKILDFSQEPPEEAEWLHQGNEATMAPAVKTVAHMVHFPGDQLPILGADRSSQPAQLDEVTTSTTGSRWPTTTLGGKHRPSNGVSAADGTQQEMPPFTIMPADSNQFLIGSTRERDSNNRPMDVRIAWKTGAPTDQHIDTRRPSTYTRPPPKIVVSAEPVPTKKSETLLVLLGIYLTFFAVASFLLFCLVLACLERTRRNSNRRQGTKTGSAILYLDAKKGTVKEVI